MGFDGWLTYFQNNSQQHGAVDAAVDCTSAVMVTGRVRRAFVRSFQRFELGESGDGARLLAKAEQAGDPVYLAALALLVQEEQRHSELFKRGLAHLDAPSLEKHWSDGAFTVLRRAIGLRTELALFLIAETVAMPYFLAIADTAPDPVLRAIGQRIAADEHNHIRFQIDRLREGFCHAPRVVRAGVCVVWWVIAAGAATVVVADHGAALRACRLRPTTYLLSALRRFGSAARAVLVSGANAPLGPAPAQGDDNLLHTAPSPE